MEIEYSPQIWPVVFSLIDSSKRSTSETDSAWVGDLFTVEFRRREYQHNTPTVDPTASCASIWPDEVFAYAIYTSEPLTHCVDHWTNRLSFTVAFGFGRVRAPTDPAETSTHAHLASCAPSISPGTCNVLVAQKTPAAT